MSFNLTKFLVRKLLIAPTLLYLVSVCVISVRTLEWSRIDPRVLIISSSLEWLTNLFYIRYLSKNKRKMKLLNILTISNIRLLNHVLFQLQWKMISNITIYFGNRKQEDMKRVTELDGLVVWSNLFYILSLNVINCIKSKEVFGWSWKYISYSWNEWYNFCKIRQ